MSRITPQRQGEPPSHVEPFQQSVDAARTAQAALGDHLRRLREHEGPHTVAVTGATGFVGRHLVRALLGAGHRVRALVRDREKAGRVLPKDERLAVVEGEILDGRSPAAVCAGADVAVHLIGIIREAPGGQTFERMHVQATEAIVSAARSAGVLRHLHMSALGVQDNTGIAYLESKFEAERRVVDSGLAWTIFRPALIHGADGEFTGMMRTWAEGRAFPFLFMPYFTRAEYVPGQAGVPRVVAPRVAPVHVDDVAAAFVGAIDNERAVGEIYNLAGPEELPFPEMLHAVRDALPLANKSIRARGIPGRAAAAKARAAAAVGLGGLLPFDEGMARMGERDVVATLTKAERHLGWRPRPFRASIREYAASIGRS